MSEFPFFLILEQFHTENILYEYVKQHAKDVLWNTELTDIKEETESIRVTCKNNEKNFDIQCKYVVGADGAKSFVRHSLQTTFLGGTYENIFFVADLEAKSNLLQKELNIFMSRKTFAAFFPMQGQNKFRMVGILPQQFADEHHVTFADIENTVKEKLQAAIAYENVNWFSVYRLHHRMANTFRRNHIFLAGDAAHIHSPVGGQGMNTGLQDAYNLIWKIWMVEQHGAKKELLDTYEEERKPFAIQLLKTTDRAFRIATNTNAFVNILRLHFMPFLLRMLLKRKKIRRFIFKTISQTGYHYTGKSLSTGKAGKIAAGMRLPFVLLYENGLQKNIQKFIDGNRFTLLLFNINFSSSKLYDFITLKLITLNTENISRLKTSGFPERFICLVRPDGYIGYISTNADAKSLDAYLQKTYF